MCSNLQLPFSFLNKKKRLDYLRRYICNENHSIPSFFFAPPPMMSLKKHAFGRRGGAGPH